MTGTPIVNQIFQFLMLFLTMNDARQCHLFGQSLDNKKINPNSKFNSTSCFNFYIYSTLFLLVFPIES